MSRSSPKRATQFSLCVDEGEDAYCAGHGDPAGDMTLLIDAEMVESAVLAKARLEVVLRPDGTLTWDPMGLSEAVIANARTKGFLADTDLASLCRVCLDEKMLGLEDEPRAALGVFRERLATCLGLVDATMKTLR
ncbi:MULTISPECIES: hypothetical protein [Rhodomicrobium]|uniref:hypothetical protein n=1 Tax=Rhodomicrobium TaxID=1068 RepID=UPI000F748444|nr:MULTISPECIES: hypothetical protein [Rhodomicrobium]